MRHIGIDLGTSNSLIAEVVKKDNGDIDVVCLKNNLGRYSFPSVLSFTERDKQYFGVAAEEKLFTDPKATVSMVKTRLGQVSSIPVEIKGKTYNISPQEISATLLGQLVKRYGDNIDRAVLTKPANYGINQNNALSEVIEISNFNVVDMIEEPSAAVMYHLYKNYKNKNLDINDFEKEKNILVFDFGGGTLDLSLVAVKKEGNNLSTRVIRNEGNCNLGGGIIDLLFEKRILEILKQRYENKFNKIYEEFLFYYDNYINGGSLYFKSKATENEIKFIFKLKKQLEEVKIKLSTEDLATIDIGNIEKITITRDQFENYVLADANNEIAIREKVRDIIDRISMFAYKKNIKIYQIVFVGGTSNIPYIRNLVINELKSLIVDFSEKNVFISQDYDTAIVKGAAILCAISDGVEIMPFNGNVCQTIVSRKIAINYLGLKEVIVEDGEVYPFKEPKVIKFNIKNALAPSQTIVFNEIEEYSDGTSTEKKVLDFKFYLPIYYTNDEAVLYFNLDKNGLYKMKLEHVFTGDEIDFEDIIVGSLSKHEKDKATKSVARLKG